MKRHAMLVLVATVVGAGVASAQQAVPPRPQTTRSYRSYSVNPSTRGTTASRGRQAGDATWRHADAKPTGQFHGGR